ncbi:MAG: DUF1501 domain-containing protein [Burkholderiales bacterium]|nr:DUF1501 domain-containing protein [Burkholderiales bacterium]
MNRREFIQFAGGLGTAMLAPQFAFAQERGGYQNLLILVELKGGNDGLNTVVPYTDSLYHSLRPRIAIKRDDVLQLDQTLGLHPALEPLMALWRERELAVVLGTGYPQPNLSHFRSIEIWDTASKADQYLHEGWMSRAFRLRAVPAAFSADGVIIGSQELGPLEGGARAVALANTEQFLNTARLARPAGSANNPTLEHILKVEADIVKAADGLKPVQGKIDFKTQFPGNGFGNVVKAAAQVIGNGEQTGKRVAALRLTLNGFDTHQNQPGTHANLLKQLAEGLVALRLALVELKRWNTSLVMTYAEFGRRPKENLSNGTDHGTVAPHVVMGGRVKGGLLGAMPDLARLDGSGNLQHTVDFRSLYATALDKWWGVNSTDVLNGKFPLLDLIR